VKDFRQKFEEDGPMKENIEPSEALDKLKDFKEQFNVHNRKYLSYYQGETLFGLPHTKYDALVKTKGELDKLDKLYSLYMKVTEQIKKWKEQPWDGINAEMERMTEGIEQFGKDCKRLPGDAKFYPAYRELKQEIEDMETLLPLVELLADECIKPRHWDELMQLTGKEIPYDSETFTLHQLLEAQLLSVKEDIEDIADSAQKQAKIQKTLEEEIDATWEVMELEIKPYSTYDYPCTIGGSVTELQEKLEEHTTTLQGMLAQRCVEPFRAEVEQRQNTFMSVADTLEKWLKVMSYWQSLVSVFMSGDISKQMPNESKIFRNVDSQWKKIMERAHEQKNFIQCC